MGIRSVTVTIISFPVWVLLTLIFAPSGILPWAATIPLVVACWAAIPFWIKSPTWAKVGTINKNTPKSARIYRFIQDLLLIMRGITA